MTIIKQTKVLHVFLPKPVLYIVKNWFEIVLQSSKYRTKDQ